MNYKIFIILSLLFLLTSCSLISPVKTDDVNQYVLTSHACPVVKKSSRRTSLFVAPVRASSIYNSTRMVYSTKPYTIDYFAKNAWADTPPQMLQTLMMQALQKTNHFKVVDSSPVGNYNYMLSSELLELKQIFHGCTSDISLKIKVKLLNAITNKVIATKYFCIIQPAYPTPYGGVVAANRAVAIFLNELAYFCVRKL